MSVLSGLTRYARVGLSSLLVVVAGGAAFRSLPVPVSAAEPAPATESSVNLDAPAGYIVHGAHISPVPVSYAAEISAFEDGVQKNLGIVMYFRPWDDHNNPCDNGYLPQYADDGHPPTPGNANGRVIMLTWQPLTILGNPGPSDYDNILSGQYDTLIDNCAEELKLWANKKFIVRLMHEMNIPEATHWAGHWYNLKPDGTGDTEKFKQAWRYIWNRFAVRNVTNVQWLWSPNYASNPNVAWNDLHNYYPGNQYVDWIGLSGYNWLGAVPYRSFTDLYHDVLTDLQCRYPKPIVLAEIASAGDEPTKTAWIADAYNQMQDYPLVRAVVWFNDYAFHNVDSADFRVWRPTDFVYNGPTSPVPASVTTAYRNAIGDSAFTSNFNSVQLLNPPATRCPGDEVSSDGVLAAQPSDVMVGRTGATSVVVAINALSLGQNTTLTVSGCPSNATCQFASSGSGTSGTYNPPWDVDTLVIIAGPGTPLGPATITITGGVPPVQIQVQVNVVAEMHSIKVPLLNR